MSETIKHLSKENNKIDGFGQIERDWWKRDWEKSLDVSLALSKQTFFVNFVFDMRFC